MRWGVDEAAFRAHLARVGVGDGPMAHEDDLELAFACALGNDAALREFEARYAREIPAALSRLRADAATIDEVHQLVREKLFVARPGATPKIADYTGKGSLLAWLRAVVVRTALDQKRKQARAPGSPTASGSTDDDPLMAVTSASDDPELEHVRARYQGPFKQAFADALGALEPEDRNVLRLFVVDGLNIEKIGALYGVHRSTVARWIAHARESLVAETRRLLSERLHVDTQEFESLTRLCRSRLDLSLHRVLGTK
jgi:RNA polymerase sigma-70 factor (ECF subfamily)